MKLNLFCILAFFISVLSILPSGLGFDVSNMNPSPGDSVVITGTASPNQAIDINSGFSMSMPAQSGKYEYVADGVTIPQKPNSFAVTAKNVKSLNVGVKIGIWLNKEFKTSSGTAYLSSKDIPPGKYALKVFGDAEDSSKPVTLEISAGTTVTADSSGKYKLSIDTTGIPSGEYRIVGDGDTKVVEIGSSEISPGSSENPASSPETPSSSSEKSTKKEEGVLESVSNGIKNLFGIFS